MPDIGGDHRLDVFTLKELGSEKPRAGRVFRLMRMDDGRWTEMGVYGSKADAQQAADQAVGRGEIEAERCRVVEARVEGSTVRRALRGAAVALLLLAAGLTVAMIIAIFLR